MPLSGASAQTGVRGAFTGPSQEAKLRASNFILIDTGKRRSVHWTCGSAVRLATVGAMSALGACLIGRTALAERNRGFQSEAREKEMED